MEERHIGSAFSLIQDRRKELYNYLTIRMNRTKFLTRILKGAILG